MPEAPDPTPDASAYAAPDPSSARAPEETDFQKSYVPPVELKLMTIGQRGKTKEGKDTIVVDAAIIARVTWALKLNHVTGHFTGMGGAMLFCDMLGFVGNLYSHDDKLKMLADFNTEYVDMP